MSEAPRLRAGQMLLLNGRPWHLRRVTPQAGRNLALELIGASEAASGMTRRLSAFQYGADLFVAKGRPGGYWRGHLEHGWLDTEAGPALACTPATGLELLSVHTAHPAGGELPNEFSWSYSRAAKYRFCPRAYYYHYYAAWEGWQPDAPEPVRRAYLLKNLTDLARWSGNLVHESIKFALSRLKAGRPVAVPDLIKQMHSRARADFEDSRRGRYRRQPNRLTGFQEHYYQRQLPGRAWQAAWTQAEQNLRTFLQSSLYAHLTRQAPATFLQLEELSSFELAGVKVWAQPDLVRREEDSIVLYDWKSGPVKPTELRQQLGVYGLYVRETWPELAGPATPLRGIVFDLAGDRLVELELADSLLAETQAMIEASIIQLRGLLLDPQANLAELRRFPMIDDLTICGRCQFRELCGRD